MNVSPVPLRGEVWPVASLMSDAMDRVVVISPNAWNVSMSDVLTVPLLASSDAIKWDVKLKVNGVSHVIRTSIVTPIARGRFKEGYKKPLPNSFMQQVDQNLDEMLMKPRGRHSMPYMRDSGAPSLYPAPGDVLWTTLGAAPNHYVAIIQANEFGKHLNWGQVLVCRIGSGNVRNHPLYKEVSRQSLGYKFICSHIETLRYGTGLVRQATGGEPAVYDGELRQILPNLRWMLGI